MNEPNMGQKHIRALDSLRGLMSWWVVAGHISTTLAYNNLYNDLAVDVFIILSGYVIFKLIDERRETYSVFITRRAFRLFPAYLVALAISIALLPLSLDTFSSQPFGGTFNQERVKLVLEAQTNFWPHLLAHLVLLQGLVPWWMLDAAPLTLIGQAWSVSLEWQFYILAPLAFYAIGHRRLWLPLALAIIALVLTTRYVTTAYLGAKVLLFGVGVGSYYWTKAVSRAQTPVHSAGCTLIFAALAMAKFGMIQIVPLGIWAAVLIATSAKSGTMVAQLDTILNWKPLQRLGAISYSTYLFHMVALVVCASILSVFSLHPGTYACLLVLVTCALTYGLSELAHAVVEKPCIRWGAILAGKMAPVRMMPA